MVTRLITLNHYYFELKRKVKNNNNFIISHITVYIDRRNRDRVDYLDAGIASCATAADVTDNFHFANRD